MTAPGAGPPRSPAPVAVDGSPRVENPAPAVNVHTIAKQLDQVLEHLAQITRHLGLVPVGDSASEPEPGTE